MLSEGKGKADWPIERGRGRKRQEAAARWARWGNSRRRRRASKRAYVRRECWCWTVPNQTKPNPTRTHARPRARKRQNKQNKKSPSPLKNRAVQVVGTKQQPTRGVLCCAITNEPRQSIYPDRDIWDHNHDHNHKHKTHQSLGGCWCTAAWTVNRGHGRGSIRRPFVSLLVSDLRQGRNGHATDVGVSGTGTYNAKLKEGLNSTSGGGRHRWPQIAPAWIIPAVATPIERSTPLGNYRIRVYQSRSIPNAGRILRAHNIFARRIHQKLRARKENPVRLEYIRYGVLRLNSSWISKEFFFFEVKEAHSSELRILRWLVLGLYSVASKQYTWQVLPSSSVLVLGDRHTTPQTHTRNRRICTDAVRAKKEKKGVAMKILEKRKIIDKKPFIYLVQCPENTKCDIKIKSMFI